MINKALKRKTKVLHIDLFETSNRFNNTIEKLNARKENYTIWEQKITLKNGSTIDFRKVNSKDDLDNIRGETYDLVVINKEYIRNILNPAIFDKSGSIK